MRNALITVALLALAAGGWLAARLALRRLRADSERRAAEVLADAERRAETRLKEADLEA